MAEPNLYQSVIDQANEKRRQLIERGYEPATELVEKVKRYLREREARKAAERYKEKFRES